MKDLLLCLLIFYHPLVLLAFMLSLNLWIDGEATLAFVAFLSSRPSSLNYVLVPCFSGLGLVGNMDKFYCKKTLIYETVDLTKYSI